MREILGFQYEGQCFPQPLYFHVRPDGCGFEVSTEIGWSTTSDIFHGRELRFKLWENYIYRDEARAFMAEHEQLIEELQESYQSEWNGNNWVGVWDTELIERVQCLIDEFSTDCLGPEDEE